MVGIVAAGGLLVVLFVGIVLEIVNHPLLFWAAICYISGTILGAISGKMFKAYRRR